MRSCSKATQVGLALISSSPIPSVTFPLELLRSRVPYFGSFIDAVTLTLVILPSRGTPKKGLDSRGDTLGLCGDHGFPGIEAATLPARRQLLR